jgi:cystathionine beta-lyase/cystathionine gamma-synthase
MPARRDNVPEPVNLLGGHHGTSDGKKHQSVDLQHAITRKQMHGFSGMFNFDIERNPTQRPELTSRLKLFTYATCLGHDESLITVYDDYKGSEFFWVSVGLEDPQDLIADLNQALEIVQVDR